MRLFESDVRYEIAQNDRKNFKTRLPLNSYNIIFSAERIDSDHWYVMFFDDAESDKKSELTNKGHQFQVINFVIKSLDGFIDIKNPRGLIFHAYTSRSSIYEKLFASRIMRRGYEFILKNRGLTSDFVFYKK